jgi:hypothetical protein
MPCFADRNSAIGGTEKKSSLMSAGTPPDLNRTHIFWLSSSAEPSPQFHLAGKLANQKMEIKHNCQKA